MAKLLGLGLERLGKWKDGEGAKPLKNAGDSRGQEPENTEQAGVKKMRYEELTIEGRNAVLDSAPERLSTSCTCWTAVRTGR